MNQSAIIVLLKAVGLSFLRAFIAVFIVGLAGVVNAADWNAAKAALVALVVASITAGIRACQALFTNLLPTDQHVN